MTAKRERGDLIKQAVRETKTNGRRDDLLRAARLTGHQAAMVHEALTAIGMSELGAAIADYAEIRRGGR